MTVKYLSVNKSGLPSPARKNYQRLHVLPAVVLHAQAHANHIPRHVNEKVHWREYPLHTILFTMCSVHMVRRSIKIPPLTLCSIPLPDGSIVLLHAIRRPFRVKISTLAAVFVNTVLLAAECREAGKGSVALRGVPILAEDALNVPGGSEKDCL